MKKRNYIILGFAGLVLILIAGMAIAEKPQTQELNRAVVKIDSLTCGGCFSTINAGLSPLEGYSGMGANLFRKLIAIDFVAPLTAEKISQTIFDLGYPGKLETVEAISKKESFAYIESKRTGFISGGGSCGGGYPGLSNGNQGSSGKAPSPSGSCCPQSGGSQPTQDL